MSEDFPPDDEADPPDEEEPLPADEPEPLDLPAPPPDEELCLDTFSLLEVLGRDAIKA